MDDAGDGLKLSARYREHYPFALVPMLELDDGTQVGEAMAICRYFENLHPDPPLMGRNAIDRALVDMWERRAYDEGLIGAAEVFRNTHPAFENRGIPGYSEPVPQIPALVTRGHQRLRHFFSMFDRQLSANQFVVGNSISVADITTLCSIDFARMAKVALPEEYTHLHRWYRMMSERPSAKA